MFFCLLNVWKVKVERGFSFHPFLQKGISIIDAKILMNQDQRKKGKKHMNHFFVL